MSIGAWSADYGSPWSASAAAPRCSSAAAADALALNGMGNSLSYFNGGGGGEATATAPSSSAPAAAAAPRRPSTSSRRSSGDGRSRRSFVDPTGGDDDDEYHDSTPYFSADPAAAAPHRGALDSFRHDAASSSEDAAQRSASAKSTRNGRAHPVAPPRTHPTSSSVIRDRGAPSCINNNDASLKDRFAPAASSNGSCGRAAEVCANDASVPTAAVAPGVRHSAAARAPPAPPPRSLPAARSADGGGGPPAVPNVAGKVAGGIGGDGDRSETFAPNPPAVASGGSASVAKRTRPACAPRTLVDIDKELANIISTVEQLSQKANSVAPAADAVAVGGGAPTRNGYASAPPAPQLSPRDTNPSNDLANELRSAIEARVKRSVSLKDQQPPTSGATGTAAASAHRHRRTNSLTYLDEPSGEEHRQLERVDSEARSRDRRARLLHMERRREQQLSEVRGGACADIAPVKEDLCADGEQP